MPENSQDGQKEKFKGKATLLMKKSGSQRVESASRLIDARIQELGDWRGEMLSRLRALIKQVDPKVVEEWKWGIPVWSHDGLICTRRDLQECREDHIRQGGLVG
jgi:hypothetical protein